MFLNLRCGYIQNETEHQFWGAAKNYRKRGSASYIVREWLLWVVESERERERERERDACDVIDITLKSQVIMHNILLWLPRRRVGLHVDAFWACQVLEVEVHVKTRSLALERSIEQQGRVIFFDDWRWGSGVFAFAGQPAVDPPAAFRWHASSKKNRPSWRLFPFRMAPVRFCLWEQLG